MAHNEQDVSIHAGDDKTLRVTVTDGGTAVDITGATITWRLRRAPGATDVLTKTTTGGGVTINDGPNGVFDVTITDTDTAPLAGLYYHEGEIEETDGTKTTVVTGDFIVEPE